MGVCLWNCSPSFSLYFKVRINIKNKEIPSEPTKQINKQELSEWREPRQHFSQALLWRRIGRRGGGWGEEGEGSVCVLKWGVDNIFEGWWEWWHWWWRRRDAYRVVRTHVTWGRDWLDRSRNPFSILRGGNADNTLTEAHRLVYCASGKLSDNFILSVKYNRMLNYKCWLRHQNIIDLTS